MINIQNKNSTVIITASKTNMQPYYYYWDKKRFFHGKNIATLIKTNEIIKEINWDFWKEYFAFGYPLGNKTPFKNIFSVPNGSRVTCLSNSLRIEKYWNYDKIKIDYSKTEKEFIKEGVKILRQTILAKTKNIKNCVVPISGGYDSRCIASSLRYFTDINFKTYTTIHPSGKIDAKIGIEVAKRLGKLNKFVNPPKSVYSKYFVKKIKILESLCHENIWVLPLLDALPKNQIIFDGLAGDTLLRGYAINPRQVIHNYKNYTLATKEIFKIIYRPNKRILDYLEDKNFFNEGDLKERIKLELEHYELNPNLFISFALNNRTKNVPALSPYKILDTKVKCICPFLDEELVKFALSIPPKFKLRNRIYYHLLKKAFPNIMKIHSTTNLNKLTITKEVVNYYLEYFNLALPIKKVIAWFEYKKPKKELNKQDIDYLINLANRIEFPSFINKNKLIKDAKNYRSLNKNSDYFLVPIMEFVVWYNLFFECKEVEGIKI